MSFFPSREPTELERRLRAAAPAFGPRPPADLHTRIVAGLRAPRSVEPFDTVQRFATFEPPLVPASGSALGSWIAAAAAALVLCSAWWLTHRPSAPGDELSGGQRVVALSRDLLEAGTLVHDFPRQAEGNLLLEAEKLLADTTRVAAGVVRGLPAPLRERLAQM